MNGFYFSMCKYNVNPIDTQLKIYELYFVEIGNLQQGNPIDVQFEV